jgi:hypothetical protein
LSKTARFGSRQTVLSQALSLARLRSVWKDSVRAKLRDQPIPDLHDYYDFHLFLDNRSQVIRDSVLDGIYLPSLPLRIRKEKNMAFHVKLLCLDLRMLYF